MSYKIFGEEIIEEGALHQFHDARKESYVTQAALMPDAHLGFSLPIGGVVATEGVILPSWVGYDIGCGVATIKTPYKLSDVSVEVRKEIHNRIHQDIPTGFASNATAASWEGEGAITKDTKDLFEKKGRYQLGSLGGGNHFLEIGHDAEDSLWVTVHSGSRGFGWKVAQKYMKLAGGGRARDGNYPLSVNSEEGAAYINDMNFCLDFALENRRQLLLRAVGAMSLILEGVRVPEHRMNWETFVNRNHNHADFKDGVWIHRKGATHAEKDMLGVIPGNMRDGVFIVRGLGNSDSLCSSSHGAGRTYGRRAAKEALDVDTFKSQMDGIVADVDTGTLDESPDAYKDVFSVLEFQHDLVDVVSHIKPIINVKAKDEKAMKKKKNA